MLTWNAGSYKHGLCQQCVLCCELLAIFWVAESIILILYIKYYISIIIVIE